MMSKIKNFFYKVWLVIKKVSLKLWQWIKKAYSVSAAFLKENVWAAVLSIVVGILLFILLVQGIVKGIDKINNKTTESSVALKATTVTSSELMKKINNEETFVLFIGSQTCGFCKQFYKTINAYVSSGHEVFYIDLGDASDPTMSRYYNEIKEKLEREIPADRNIPTNTPYISTPSTVYVEKGLFKDVVQGAVGMSGGEEYLTFCDVIEGKYVGKGAHPLVSASSAQ